LNHHRLRIPLVLALASWLSVGASDPARDAAPPPSPEFKRPANALFADDFSDSTLRGWRAPDSSASAWSVRNGVLRGDVPDVKQARAFLLVGDSTWTDYAVDVDVCGMRGADKGVGVRVRNKKALGVDVRGSGAGKRRTRTDRGRTCTSRSGAARAWCAWAITSCSTITCASRRRLTGASRSRPTPAGWRSAPCTTTTSWSRHWPPHRTGRLSARTHRARTWPSRPRGARGSRPAARAAYRPR